MKFLHWLLFLVEIFPQIKNSICSPIPENWKDYIAPDMLKKYEGRGFSLYSEKFFQGDIDGVDKDLPEDQLKGTMNNAITDEKKRWPNGVVPYVLSNQYVNDEKLIEKILIEHAMDIIASSTGNCIQFVPRTDQQDYIQIIRGVDCDSSVGRQGGKQTVSYTRGCLEEIGSIQHELMHALGFYHEHSRVDRDKYIWIKWENLLPYAVKDFNISTDATTFGLPYDYESVLHYGFNAFAINRFAPTIIPKEKGKRIGQQSNLSVLDILKLRKAYNCSDADEITPSKTVALDQATGITRGPNTKQEVFAMTTAAQVETTGRKIRIQTNRPKPLDLTLLDFKKGNLTDLECKSMTTSHCLVESWARCSTGLFGFYCNGSSTDFEIRHHFEKIKRTIPSSPILITIGGKIELNPVTFRSVSNNIVFFAIEWSDGFNCDKLKNLPLLNLLELRFGHSTNITVNRDSFRLFRKMRFLRFEKSTILHLERGSLESLISLETVAFDFGIASPLSLEERSHLWRVHCSAEYAWLRNYLDQHRKLIQPRKQGEIYSLPGITSREWTRRNLFYPVDCKRNNLTGDQNQVEFSIND